MPSFSRAFQQAGEIGREWVWWWRNTLTWSLPAIRRSRSWTALSRTLPPAARAAAAELATRFDLSRWTNACDAQGFRESLYVLDLLDRHAGPPCCSPPYLDIGCKNGCYLPGLQAWSNGPWDGVELDAHRRYWTLVTRRACGESVARYLPDCRYVAGNLLELNGSYGFISWFLPFLHEAPLRAWGLPARFLMPLALLEHAWALLAPGGRLFVVNQGEAEADRQARLFQKAGIRAQPLGRVESPLSPFQRPRFGWLADKS